MAQGIVRQICIAPTRRAPMISVQRVMALQGKGLEGDRYAAADGSYSFGEEGRRQVTLMHTSVLRRLGGYSFVQTRRSLLISGDDVELIWLFAKRHEFEVGSARLKAIGYCDPCDVPTQQARKPREQAFKRLYAECGGIIAEVIRSGSIAVGDNVVAPDKGY